MKRRILVVGASRGIGAAVSQFYDSSGDDVISVSRTPSKIGEWIGADISKPDGIKQVIRTVSARPIDALLFMGGAWEMGAFTDDYDFETSSHAETQAIINVNLIAPIEITKGLLENLRKSANPRAVFMGATSGLELSSTLEVAYSASKFGLRGAIHALRLGFEKEGIGFTVINPGYVGTEEVLADIESGQSAGLVPIPMADLLLAVDFVLRSSRDTDVGDITLTQKFVS